MNLGTFDHFRVLKFNQIIVNSFLKVRVLSYMGTYLANLFVEE